MLSVGRSDFTEVRECEYEGERYSVRNNGAVLRHHRVGKRARAQDNEWTFGKTNSSNPYLHIASVRVHRIVATAFHGEPPDPKYVVDHIDSNCKNNRPENLRWLTRLENTLLNPVTRKKIEYLCGSIEAFLENPSMLNAMDLEPNTAWMRAVTREEAQNCKARMAIWASAPQNPASTGGGFTEKIFAPLKRWEFVASNPELNRSLTPLCAQIKWRIPSNFPCCPQALGDDPLSDYFQNLKVGVTFSHNDAYPASTVVEFAKSNDQTKILVLCEREGMKPWSLAEVKFESGLFVHSNLGSFFGKDGAEKHFFIERGMEWTGGNTFDDYC